MIDSVRQQVEHLISERGDQTAVVIVFAQKSPDPVLRISFGVFALDRLNGEQEHKEVVQLCKETGGDLRAVCVFRWPVGTPDARILSDITMEFDETVKIAGQGKSFIPARYCWGDLGGKVNEQFVQQVAPRLVRAHEQAEIAWGQSRPTSFLVSVGQEKGEIEWRATVTVTPDKLMAMTDNDYLWKAIEDASDQHNREYGTFPKAIASVEFLKRMAMRNVQRDVESHPELGEVVEPLRRLAGLLLAL